VTTTPADSPIRILHLSDFHFSTRSQWDADPILRALAGFIADDAAKHDLYPDLVVITGDLAQSGKSTEYKLARQWLDELWPRLTRDPATPLPRDRLLLVPGNHDVDRDLIEPGARDAHQALLAAKTQEAVTERLQSRTTRELLFKRHAAYLKCYGDWLGRRQTLPWWQRRIRLHNQDLHVAGLDSAWLADRDDDSRLLLGTDQINQTVQHQDGEGDCDWRIALLHHPWASLAEFDRTEAQRTLHRHRDLILRGHLHEPDLFRIVPADPRRSCIEAAAGCCYSGKPYPNAFQWIELARDPRRVRFHFRCWNQGDWQVDRNQPGCPEGTHTIDLSAAAGAVRASPHPTGEGDRPVDRHQPGGSEGAQTIDLTAPAGGVPFADGRVQMPALQDTALVAKPRAASPGGINSGLQMQFNDRSAAHNEPTSPLAPRTDRHCDVLLLYVNDKERQAIVDAFTSRDRPPAPVRPEGLAGLDLGVIAGRHILAMKTNMGSATPGGAAPKTQEAITRLKPEWIIAVGVAFGMDPDKTPIGTILVSNRVSCYEPQRVGHSDPIRRGVSVPVDGTLHDFLHNVSSPPCWAGAKVRFGEILSGEKLIDDPDFKDQLQQAYPEAVGGEMEAAGILVAAHTAGGAWIIVKAVCDFADGQKGKDKDANQTLAAANAAQFVRYALGAYQEEEERAVRTVAPTAAEPLHITPQPRPVSPIRADAIDGIVESLELVPPLRDALALRVTGAPAATARDLAEWLCPPRAEDFRRVLSICRAALQEAAKPLRQRSDGLALLRRHADDILGWMVVTTVVDGYDQEDAPLVKRWSGGAAFHIPIGRSLCLEVLSARWRRRRAAFGVARQPWQTGRDDITPQRLSAIGLNDPTRIEPGLVVDKVWCLLCQSVDGGTEPLAVDAETKDRIRARLAIQLKEEGRRRRLVIDSTDLSNQMNSPPALQAIGSNIPEIHLIVIGAASPGTDSAIFLLPAGELAGNIEECLDRIDALA